MEKRKSMSKQIREILISGDSLSTRAVAEDFYGNTSQKFLEKAQILILSNRRKIEEETGKILHCQDGVYSLISNKDTESMDQEERTRSKSAVNKLKSYKRLIHVLVRHNPELIPQVKSHLYELSVEMNELELKRIQRMEKSLREEREVLKKKRTIFGFMN